MNVLWHPSIFRYNNQLEASLVLFAQIHVSNQKRLKSK